ncbi:uncharacterized protein [Littorina saxatilis]|uniref:MRH domain-containing protein n=1 Tax=Littorina saxatilis TaxID=31220 RepID=A0AAN9AKZ0_9CAEN
MASRYIVYVLAVCATLLWKPAMLQDTTLCSSSSPCVFDCGETTLDLVPLSRDDEQPFFPDLPDREGAFQFSFSPCSSFSEGSGCANTSVCQIDPLDANNTVDVGSTASVALTQNPQTNAAVLTYTSTQGGVKRTTTVSLVCAADGPQANGTGTLSVAGEVPLSSRNYSMTLTSQYACFHKFNGNSTTEPSVITTTSESNVTSENPPTTEPPTNTTSNINGTTSESNVTSEIPPTTEPPTNTTSQSNVRHHD